MKKTLRLLLLLLSNYFIAQIPGDAAQTFGSIPGFNDRININVIQPDGKILVGGAFTTYVGATENHLIRLNSDGTKDVSFNTGIGFNNLSIYTIVLQPDGKILVGGDFTNYNGVTENHLIRLNSDGTKDTSFNTGTGFNNSTVHTIVLQPDGKILVGGDFNSYNEEFENRIVRLNSDGTNDTSFDTGVGFDLTINKITLQPDGKILVGGDFTNYNGTNANRIIRLNLDGTIDNTFIIGTGFNNLSIYTIVLQPDGKIIVGGDFTNYNGTNANRIIRLNLDGTIDNTLNTGTGFNNFAVSEIILQTDGKIIVGGEFTYYNDTSANHVIRLNSDGIKDTSFASGIGFDSNIDSIVLQTDGKIIIGGVFTTYNGTAVNRIVRLNPDGSKDDSFINGIGFNYKIQKLTIQANGKILIGGHFTIYKGVTENKIVRLNTDGTKDTSFITGSGFNNGIHAIAEQPDGKILVGGQFTTFNGVTENRIVRLNSDGSKDNTFITGLGFNNTIYTIVLQSDGKILVGGAFTTYKGVTENRIIRLNSDGTKDASFITETGFDSWVKAITLQPDGKMLIGGQFNAYKGIIEHKIVRLNANGTKDTSFITGTGFNNISVYVITIQPNGKILVGGDFNSYNGTTENYLIRLNSDGIKDTSFISGVDNGVIFVIESQMDGKILIGGDFISYNGTAENYLIRLNSDGTKDASFDTGTGFDGRISTIALQTNGKIFVGGFFTTYKGNSDSAFLIALHSETSLSTESFDDTTAFSLYPNPVKNVLNITSLSNKIASVKIYNLQGILILETNNNSINVSNLANGLYIAKIKTDKGEETKKFIKE